MRRVQHSSLFCVVEFLKRNFITDPLVLFDAAIAISGLVRYRDAAKKLEQLTIQQ
jgi:hypothetical protein